MNTLQELKLILDGAPFITPEKGDYAELVNEDDEEGLVQICRKNGSVLMVMPIEVWKELREKYPQ